MNIKTVIAFTITLVAAVASTVSAVDASDALRSTTEKLSKMAKFHKKPFTKKNKAGDKTVVKGDAKRDSNDGRLPKRFAKNGVLTINGVSHDRPLTGEEAIFLQAAIKEAWEESHKDDDITSLDVVLLKEELDEDHYFPTSIGDDHKDDEDGEDRSMLRGGSSEHQVGDQNDRELFNESIDQGDHFDIHIFLDIICILCYKDDSEDPRIIRTKAPTPPPSKNATCILCNPDDNGRPTRKPTPAPARVPTRPPTRAPTPAPVKVGLGADVGSTLCKKLRESNIPRFKPATTCILN